MGGKEKENVSQWAYLPHPAIFKIFKYLNYKELLKVGEVCQFWYQASRDDLLWKELFYYNFNVDRSVPVLTGNVNKIPTFGTQQYSLRCRQIVARRV